MKKIIFPALSALFFAGCSLMPYHNTFMCQGGKNIHICERVSQVLQNSDTINTHYTCGCNKTQTPAKTTTTKTYKPVYYPYRLQYENEMLKNMVEAISLEKLQKPIKVEVACNNDKIVNATKKVIPLNKYIKVCVYNANIRKKPSCQSEVIGVVKKGTTLFAKALINGAWIELKRGGYIHKSLICGECNCKEQK